MQLEVFRGQDMRSVVAWVQRSLGSDAMIIRTNVLKRPDGDIYEVVAAPPQELDEYRRELVVGPVSEQIATRPTTAPYRIALVGPPGAGKTTAAMKLVLHPRGVGTKKVGMITLDTYRVGAIDEAQTYAEIAGIPLEVVYHAREVEAALERLAHLDVVVIDTPGRVATEAGWKGALKTLGADEVHLVLPASLQLAVARSFRERLRDVGVTHALFTKLDEVPGDVGLAALSDALQLPVRWVGDGFEVPGELAPAGNRIVRSLGKRHHSASSHRRVG